MSSDLKHTFGFQQVDVAERRARIRRVFDAVAPRYDLMNDLMSFGIHRLWKRAFAAHVARTCPHARTIVDLAGGTGDIAALLAARHPDARIIVADPSLPMMQTGRRKLKGRADALLWLAAEGERLPFADAAIDAITIAFGLRNMADPQLALREACRALRPGGSFFCLEFSRPRRWLAPFYDLYSFHVIPRLGAAVARAPFAYRYLVESIRRFPGQHELSDMIRAAGFARVRWRDLSFGIAAIHHATKAA